MYKGIFWFGGESIISVKVLCDKNGSALEPCEFSSKSGENFNHEKEWEKLPKSVTGNLLFNYFPRGRVEIKNGKATVWLNPMLNTDEKISAILSEFDLSDEEIKIVVKCDNSKHYACGPNN